jgi:hypothetical protein
MAVLAAFPTLWMRGGFVLRAYQFCAGGNANAVVWAVPGNQPLREPDPDKAPPRPPDALDDFMEAIEGDGSPRSYLSASIFARECSELGADWHGRGWSDVQIIYEDPLKSGKTDADRWKWLGTPRWPQLAGQVRIGGPTLKILP